MPSLTLNYSTSDGNRVSRALGYILYPDNSQGNIYATDPLQNASAADVKNWLVQLVTNLVLVSERREEEAKVTAIVPPVVT